MHLDDVDDFDDFKCLVDEPLEVDMLDELEYPNAAQETDDEVEVLDEYDEIQLLVTAEVNDEFEYADIDDDEVDDDILLDELELIEVEMVEIVMVVMLLNVVEDDEEEHITTVLLENELLDL